MSAPSAKASIGSHGSTCDTGTLPSGGTRWTPDEPRAFHAGGDDPPETTFEDATSQRATL